MMWEGVVKLQLGQAPRLAGVLKIKCESDERFLSRAKYSVATERHVRRLGERLAREVVGHVSHASPRSRRSLPGERSHHRWLQSSSILIGNTRQHCGCPRGTCREYVVALRFEQSDRPHTCRSSHTVARVFYLFRVGSVPRLLYNRCRCAATCGIRAISQREERAMADEHLASVSVGDVEASNDRSNEAFPRTSVRVGVAQMTSTGDVEENFATCQSLVEEARLAGCKLLSLPECFSFIGEKEGESLGKAQPLDGPLMGRYQQLARDSGLWIALGGFQESGPDPTHLYNTHVLLDGNGNIHATYRKIHLFDVDVPGGPKLKESNSTTAGTEIVAVDSPAGRLGLTICYDLRFPEVYQRLRFINGAEVMLVPAAFTKTTGEAHWETLLRARAIECQSYVLAAAQAGRHNVKRESFGHSLIIDPWGKVVGRLEDPLATGVAVADLDFDLIDKIRQRMPVSQHRRYDIYGYCPEKKE